HRSLYPCQLVGGLERIPARTRPHLGAVDGNLGERYHSFGNQRRHAFRQQPVEYRHMRHSEVGKPVIVQRYPAGDPPIRQIALRKPLELPCRADPLNRRIKPQRQHNRRIRRWPPGLAFARFDRLIKRRKVQALDKAQYDPGPMIARQQRLQINEVPSRLKSVRPNEPRLARHRITSLCSESESQAAARRQISSHARSRESSASPGPNWVPALSRDERTGRDQRKSYKAKTGTAPTRNRCSMRLIAKDT